MDVSGQPANLLVREAVDRGMAIEAVLEGTDLDAAEILDARKSLDWPSFSRICANIQTELGDEAMIAIGRGAFDQPFWRYIFVVLRLFGDPARLYAWGVDGPLPKIYPCMRFSGHHPQPGVFALRMVPKPPYAPSFPLMLAFLGQCQAAAELCGHDPSPIHIHPVDGGYELRMPGQPREGLRKRIARRLGTRSALEDAAADIGDVQVELLERLRALEREVQQRQAAQAALEAEVREREALATQVAQTQRLRSVGLLAGGVAHDFNNVLVVIQANTELALHALRDQDALGQRGEHPSPRVEEASAHLEEVLKASARAANLTGKLLTAGRRQVIEPAPLELEATVAEMLPLLEPLLARARVRLEFTPAPTPAMIHADPGQIEQILLNLCVNARDASEPGAVVSIETDAVVFDADYVETNPWAREGRYALLRVSDRGVGMTPEVRERLFDPFFTTKAMGSGTGLGMSVVLGAVEQHEGLLQVYSEPGVGTTITVYLPQRAEQGAAQTPDRPRGQAPRGSEPILLVDDDPPVREVALNLLTGAGYEVVATATAEAALAALETRLDATGDGGPPPFALAVLDVVLPDQPGPELAALARARCPELAVLFTSGYSVHNVDRELLSADGVDYLTKPYGGQQLLWRVREALDRAQGSGPQ